MNNPEIRVFEDQPTLARAAAEKVLAVVLASLAKEPEVHIALTGGRVGTMTLEALSGLTANVDFARLHIWWIDDRFVSATSKDRNELQARKAWLDKSSVPSENIHPFPSSDDGTIESTARVFAQAFQARNPHFALVLLGMGEDGHVASLFPEGKAVAEGEWVVIEANSPKPPAERLSLSLKALNRANEVVFLVSGIQKAEAVRNVLSGSSDLPAARVQGTSSTTWLLDQEAASLTTSS
jgi:6-phosphogluconolactonase